jgi:hypothetical protein
MLFLLLLLVLLILSLALILSAFVSKYSSRLLLLLSPSLQFRAIGFALATSVTASVLFTLASIRCDTFQFQTGRIRFGLWRIENAAVDSEGDDDGDCVFWHTDDAWVLRSRVASILGHVLGLVIAVYLATLLASSTSCGCGFRYGGGDNNFNNSSSTTTSQHQHQGRSSCATFLKRLIPTSLLTYWLVGAGIAIGLVGTVSLASTIVNADLCQGQCTVQFTGLYFAAMLWAASGFSLLLIPLYTNAPPESPLGMDIESSNGTMDRSWKRQKRSDSATSNEDHNTDESNSHEEPAGFAIVKTFYNGETHITETVNEPDGTIRRTHIVKSPDGTQRVSARVYDEANGPYMSDDDRDGAENGNVAAQMAQQDRMADNEKVVQILLGDSPQDARPVSTTIHWGVPSPHRILPVTYFQEPPLEVEAPAPFAASSESTSSATSGAEAGIDTMPFFPCPVHDIMDNRGGGGRGGRGGRGKEGGVGGVGGDKDVDDDENMSGQNEVDSVPSTIAFNNPLLTEDGDTVNTGPRLFIQTSLPRNDVV